MDASLSTDYWLQIIGEAGRSTSSELKDAYDEIPWGTIVDFRNLVVHEYVVHEYFRVDLDVVWDVVNHDLPSLKLQIEKILSELR